MIDFSGRLKAERKRLGLNQTDFGALLGVTKQTQMLYEKGQRKPDADYLMAATKHDIDVHYLIYGEGVTEQPTLIDHELMDHIIERLEAMAKELNKQWPANKLMRTAVQVYNFVQEGDDVDTEEKMDRVLRLVVDR